MRPSSISLLQPQSAVQPIICFDPLEASASSHVTVHHAAEHKAPAQSRCVISSFGRNPARCNAIHPLREPSEADRRGRARLSQIRIQSLHGPMDGYRSRRRTGSALRRRLSRKPVKQTPPRRFLLLSSGLGAVTQRNAARRIALAGRGVGMLVLVAASAGHPTHHTSAFSPPSNASASQPRLSGGDHSGLV